MKSGNFYEMATLIPLIAVLLLLNILPHQYTLALLIDRPTSYWIWAGVTVNDAPRDADLYIFQGQMDTKGPRVHFQRGGLYPYPLEHRNIYLVYRLEGELPPVKTLLSRFEIDRQKWQAAHADIKGIQIDFDSATSKLLQYSDFLREFRRQLPQPDQLSITGLSDWALNADRETMENIHQISQSVVYQLYQGRAPVRDVDLYLLGLKSYPWPYQIGVLNRPESQKYIEQLRGNPHFSGVMVFIQK